MIATDIPCVLVSVYFEIAVPSASAPKLDLLTLAVAALALLAITAASTTPNTSASVLLAGVSLMDLGMPPPLSADRPIGPRCFVRLVVRLPQAGGHCSGARRPDRASVVALRRHRHPRAPVLLDDDLVEL